MAGSPATGRNVGERRLSRLSRRCRKPIRRFRGRSGLILPATPPRAAGVAPDEKIDMNDSMKKIQVYDPPMCCPTGVCGPAVDPALVQFAADLKWLTGQGVVAERFNLTQNPGAFTKNELVRSTLMAADDPVLPLLVVDGKVVAKGAYPTRAELVSLLGLEGDGNGNQQQH
jgi:hypothetical protein